MDKAIGIIARCRGAVVALSAGVDSSLVAALAKRALENRTLAITAVSESLAPGEIEIAKKTAEQIGIKHLIVTTDEIHNPDYNSNPSNRCYYCKDTLYRELRRQANNCGFEAVLDGTQIDDFGDVRPGLVAARELGVRSPLAEAGFTKKDVREAARAIGLDVWDKPAMPCLSSRIQHGDEITVQKLSQIAMAESAVKRLSGARDLRVRHRGTHAAIEVAPSELELFREEVILNRIKEELEQIGFENMSIGPLKRSGGVEKSVPQSGLSLPIVNIPDR